MSEKKITPEHHKAAQGARELAMELAAMAGVMEDARQAEKVYRAVRTITALADLYDERRP